MKTKQRVARGMKASTIEVTKKDSISWPKLCTYDQNHLAKIALPLGGIGTGTISLGGRGDLRDWEIVNRPAKGFIPTGGCTRNPFFALYARETGQPAVARLLEGPLEYCEYEGFSGVTATNHGLPRFRECRFSAAYPLGQVDLVDPAVPLSVRLEAFNPLVPLDPDASGIPIVALRYVLTNTSAHNVTAAVCATLPNFIGNDGRESPTLNRAVDNRNTYRESQGLRGIFMHSEGVCPDSETWGTMALATTQTKGVTWRTQWSGRHWGAEMLEFWEDFSTDGRLSDINPVKTMPAPLGSLSARIRLAPKQSRAITFLVAWHFPNRLSWGPNGQQDDCGKQSRVGNYYCTSYKDAWDVLKKTTPRLNTLERKTVDFVRTFCLSDMPPEIKEAALFNLANLRSQTCFRTEDGHFFGFEGCRDNEGCCWGSCTHVWNYEQAVPFLFGSLARDMRRIEFLNATQKNGLMAFRVALPLDRALELVRAAADGQMGCLMKLYREWQLSGDEKLLQELWPAARRTLEFCWISGGWDADRDGVMEGCQHNTMDVEYYGPNPQMQGWYLGALRACEEIARHLNDTDFADTCRHLFEQGSRWMDEHLFNGEYYEQEIRPPTSMEEIAEGLISEKGCETPADPQFQLGSGCLIDQLVGQYMAHICRLGYLHNPKYVRKTLDAILRYNRRTNFHAHFNSMRTYATGDESALLMAGYPYERPPIPFPYFTEVMTGFEYTAAAGLIFEGKTAQGCRVIRDIRARFDGSKRSPFNEAECGHHYARAMASWSALIAYTGFHYSAVTGIMQFGAREGRWFWSTGDAWGEVEIKIREVKHIELIMHAGHLALCQMVIKSKGSLDIGRRRQLTVGDHVSGNLT